MSTSSPGDRPLPPVLPLSWNGSLPAPDVRTIEELRNVLARPDCPAAGPAYYMYRGVAQSAEDRDWLQDKGLRFDITVIPPRGICGEYIKTKGHFHPENPSGTGYPEVYEVLAGEAHYLIQTRDCSDVVMVAARAGDIVIVPPGYGHVTINPSKRVVLEMANIVSFRFSSRYEEYEERRGAAYYEMETGEMIRNPVYRDCPGLRFVQARHAGETTGTFTDPLYRMIQDRSPILTFLNFPEHYSSGFWDLYR